MKVHPNSAKTKCKYGHPFTTENTYLATRGSRSCRKCKTGNDRKHRHAIKNGLVIPGSTEPIKDKFERQVEKTKTCWLWTGAIAKTEGYGRLNFMRKVWWAHRVSYSLHKGSIPKGSSVLHSCDVRKCVNPEHLFLGTQADNVKDMVSKGRYWSEKRIHSLRCLKKRKKK
jgi:hypothetical protein